MGAISNFFNLALAHEDSYGRVMAGSTGKGARTLWADSANKSLDGSNRVARFINLSKNEVGRFDKGMELASDVFDSKTLKALRKSGKTNKEYYNKVINFLEGKGGGKPTEEEIATFLNNNLKDKFKTNGIKESRGFFKSIKTFFTGGEKAKFRNVEQIAKESAEKLAKPIAGETGEIAGKVAKTAAKSNIFKSLFKSLKGKGGTIAIALSVGFEAFNIVKAIINKDNVAKQVGRSTFNLAGFAGGAAAGAAIGSIIPIAGTAVGGFVGALIGFVGGMVGGSLAGKAGEYFFGKSKSDLIAEQKEKQQEALALQSQGLNTVA